MASEADSSISLAPSTSQNSQTRGRSAFTTWVHSRAAWTADGEDPTYNYCIHYTGEDKEIFKTYVTTNMRNHLRTEHGIIVERPTNRIQASVLEQLEQLYIQAEASGETDDIDKQVFRRRLDQHAINEALISLIVVRNLSFRCVEWPELHTLCQVLNPESYAAITTAHSQIGIKIAQAFDSHKDTIRKKLQSALTSIHISIDVWTAPNKHLLLAVVADFVDYSTEKHTKALLGLPLIKGHAGEVQFGVLLPVLQDYGIVRKLGAIIGDNATTNDTLCREIEDYLLEEEGLSWDAEQWRCRCLGHIINLAVQAFLFHNELSAQDLESYDTLEASGNYPDNESTKKKFRLLGPLGQLHNIVVHIRGSSLRTAQWLELAERMIPLDNRTRWNSWYLLLEVADPFESVIDQYVKIYWEDLSEDYISPSDWIKLRTIRLYLYTFYKATLKTQGHRATIDSVLFTMDVLAVYFKKTHVS
jgi:hypothetical protein